MNLDEIIETKQWLYLSNMIELKILSSITESNNNNNIDPNVNINDNVNRSNTIGNFDKNGKCLPSILIIVYLLNDDYQSAKYTWKRFNNYDYVDIVSEFGKRIIKRDFLGFFNAVNESYRILSSIPVSSQSNFKFDVKELLIVIDCLVNHIRSNRLIHLSKSYSTIRKDYLTNQLGINIQQLNDIQNQLKLSSDILIKENDSNHDFVDFIHCEQNINKKENYLTSTQQLIKLTEVINFLSSSVDGNILKSTSNN